MEKSSTAHEQNQLVSNRAVVFVATIILFFVFSVGVAIYFVNQSDEMMAKQAELETSLTQDQIADIAWAETEFLVAERGVYFSATNQDSSEYIGLIHGKLENQVYFGRIETLDNKFLLSVGEFAYPGEENYGALKAKFNAQ